MAWVTRYRIEDGARVFNGTEFTTDESELLAYVSEEEAWDDADQFGGVVVKFSRYRPEPAPIVRGANIAQRDLVAAE
jgi:hypothetical protein